MIELRDVTKIYQLGSEKIIALDRVSLKIDRGDFLAIVGPSGSGKSTLANIIGGLDVPDKGRLLVDGIDYSRVSDTELSHYRNKRIGFIFQAFNLQPMYSALENVTVPLVFAKVAPDARRKRGLECLEAVGLADRINHNPGQLSGGQRQRVCIARALANNPEVIIADEPTGNLDSKKGAEIVGLLSRLNEEIGVTLVVITHEPAVAEQAKKVLSMKDGLIREEAKCGSLTT